MRIWHQSFTDLTVMALYRKTLAEQASAVMGRHISMPNGVGEFTEVEAQFLVGRGFKRL